jgi:FlgD Ig-like domain
MPEGQFRIGGIMNILRLHRILAMVLFAVLAFGLAVASPAFAQKIWNGLGDGTSWSDGANWVGGVAPISTDLVLLDNSAKASPYSVLLPSGAITTSIVRLTIAPAAFIILTLPATNTAIPGLRVGDASAATDDIILKTGAFLINRSGTGSGNGIEANTTVNGTVRIENGASYLHNTARSASGVAPLLSTAAGTEHGLFEYDSPGTGSVAIIASGRTYGDLKLTRTSGAGTYTSSGGSVLTVRGEFWVNPGVTYTSGMTAEMRVGGHWTNYGVAVTLPPTQPLRFDGSLGPVSVTGVGTNIWNGGGTVAAAANVTVSSESSVALGGTVTDDGAFNVRGTLRINDGGAVVNYPIAWDGGQLLYYRSSSYAVNATDAAWPASSGPPTVEVHGGGITMNTARTVATVKAAGPITNAGNLTVTDTLQMNAGGSVAAAPVYGTYATLFYSTGIWAVGPEWSSGQIVGAGVPRSVTLDTGTGNTVSMPGADRYLPGVLRLTSGTLVLNAIAGDLHLGDDFMIYAAASLLPQNRKLILDGNLGVDRNIQIYATNDVAFDVLKCVDAHVGLVNIFGPIVFQLGPTNGGESLRLEGASDIHLNSNTVRFAGNTSTLAVKDGARTLFGPGVIDVTVPLTVVDGGGGGTLLFESYNLSSRVIAYLRAPVDFGTGLTTFDGGDLVLKPGGSVIRPPVYFSNSAYQTTLVYDGANFGVGPEWSAGTSEGLGVPHNVTIAAGAGNGVLLPTGDRYVPANLTLSSGELVLNATAGDLHVCAGLFDGPTGAVVCNGRTLILDGNFSASHDITLDIPWDDTLQVDHLKLDNAHVGFATKAGPAFLKLSSPSGGESLHMRGNSDLHLNGNVVLFAGGASTLAVANGARTISGPGTIQVNSPLTVTNAGSGGSFTSDVLNGLLRAPADMGAGLTTISGGSLVLKPGGSIAGNHPPSYANGATLAYDVAGAVLSGAEWSAGSGPGYPVHVTIVDGTTLYLDGGLSGSFACSGVLTVDAGADVTANLVVHEVAGPVTIGGSLVANGPITMSTLPGNDWRVDHAVTIAAPLTQNGRALVLSGSTPAGLVVEDGVPSLVRLRVTKIGSGSTNLLVNGASPAVANLEIATTGVALTTLASELTITNLLTLAGRDIVTNGHTLAIAPGASVARTSGSVRGNLQKHIAPTLAALSAQSVASLALTYEVGSASGYTPVDVTYATVASPGELTVSTTASEHPDAAASGMDAAKDVNRFWTLALDRAPDPSESFTATFHWLAIDQDPSSDFNLYDVYGKSGTWTHTVAGVRASDHTTADGLTKYGDYCVGTPTGVTSVPQGVPAVTFMRSAGPNPFHEATVIAYGLRQRSHVKVTIFDVAGQRVRTLVDDEVAAGPGTARWNGRDNSGHVVASGFYVARMEADGRKFNVPLCLVR